MPFHITNVQGGFYQFLMSTIFLIQVAPFHFHISWLGYWYLAELARMCSCSKFMQEGDSLPFLNSKLIREEPLRELISRKVRKRENELRGVRDRTQMEQDSSREQDVKYKQYKACSKDGSKHLVHNTQTRKLKEHRVLVITGLSKWR